MLEHMQSADATHERVRVSIVDIASAKAACGRWHRTHEPPLSGLWAMAAWCEGRCVCVAIVSRPVSRVLDNGRTVEVSRLASDGSVRGAASAVLRACVREAIERGFVRVVSYTMLGEVGACYRAARWRPVALTKGGQWSTPARPREATKQPGRKVRWEAGPAAAERSSVASAAIVAHAGRVGVLERVAQQLALEVG